MTEATTTDLTELIRKGWDDSAQAWNNALDKIDADGTTITQRLITDARITKGHHVLDVASGVGEPALTIADTVGPDGRVVSQDISGEMLRLGRERADNLGITNVEFLHGDLDHDSLSDQQFDAVVCRWGLMLIPDPDRVLTRLHQLIRPGGRISFATWGPPETVPFASVPGGAIASALETPPPPPGGPGLHAIPSPEAASELLDHAGFNEITTATLNYSITTSSAEELVSILKDTAAPLRAMLANATPEHREHALNAAIDALRPFEREGACRLDNQVVVAAATSNMP